MKQLFLLITVFFASLHLNAQATRSYSLQECIDSALRKNISLRQSKLASSAADYALDNAKSQQLPSVYGNLDQGFNTGRNVDPFNNEYVNRNINFGIYGITTGMTVFSGLSIRNTVKQNQYFAEAARTDMVQSKKQVTLNVILAYLNVLSAYEQLELSKSQAILSNAQLEKLELKGKKGVIAPSEVSDIKGQLLNDQLNIVNLTNVVEWYKMELAQQMNIPYQRNMTLSSINVEELTQDYGKTSTQVYNEALNDFPLVMSAELRSQAAMYGLKAAKGLSYPTVFAGTTVQTAFTSSARTVDGKINFQDQFLNNRTGTVNLGVRIPIFTGGATKSQIRLADVNLQSAKLEEDNVKMAVWQEVERAHLAMTNAFIRYQTVQKQLVAYQQSFTASEARLNTGVDKAQSYLLSKNNLDRANIALINAKYDFILKKKVLDFYQSYQ